MGPVLSPSLSVSKVHSPLSGRHLVLTLGQPLDGSESVALSGHDDTAGHSRICIQVLGKLQNTKHALPLL